MRIRVYKREGKKGTRWWLDYHWAGRRWRYPVADTKDSATKIASRIVLDADKGTFKGPKAHEKEAEAKGVWTFGRLCDEWLEIRKPNIRPSTLEFYSDILRRLKKDIGEDRTVAEITSFECRKLVAKKRAESESPVRANRYVTVLKSLFSSAVDWEIVHRDPARGLKKERETTRWRILSAQEQEALVAACEDWLRPVVLTALYTGARRADLLGTGKRRGGGRPLRWPDVDLDAKVITFTVTKEKKVRLVPIRDELIRVLRWLPSRKHDGEVFLDHKGKLVTPERASERLKVAAVKAEIPDARKLRFHDLRHTCATNLLNSGVPVHAVKAWLGHAKLETTDRYSHAGLNDLRRHAAKLDGTNAAQAAEPTGS